MAEGRATIPAVPIARRRWYDRPGIVLLLGGTATATLVALAILNPADATT